MGFHSMVNEIPLNKTKRASDVWPWSYDCSQTVNIENNLSVPYLKPNRSFYKPGERLHKAAKSKCETISNSGSSELKYLVMLLSTRPTLTWELNNLSTTSRFALSQVQISYRSYKTVMFPHRRLYGRNFLSSFQRYMYFSVHLMRFLDQTINDPTWYYAGSHVVLLFLCKCGQSWFTRSLCCLL